VPRALEVAQQHDLQQRAHVQAARSRVKAEVRDDAAAAHRVIERGQVGRLVEEAAPAHRLQKRRS